jgi:ribosomal biogenesis protein LAS1
LHNYFLPTLNPSPAQAQAHPPSIVPVEPLLRRYKSLLKTVSRDASLRARLAADISGVLREIERWIVEARVGAAVHANAGEFASSLSYRGRHAGDQPVAVAAVVDNGDDDDDDGDDEEPEPREAWALDRLCDALLVKGALVPISRKSVIDVLSQPFFFLSKLIIFPVLIESEYLQREAHTIRPRPC